LLPSLGKEALNVVDPLDELLSVTTLRSSYSQSLGSDRTARYKNSNSLGVSLPEDGNKSSFRNVVFLKQV
jgi:hypothetical protein